MFNVFQAYLQDKITLSEEEMDRIRSVSIVKKLHKKQFLLQEGDVWKYDAFVSKGCLRTYSINEKGLEHILNFAVENWWTGDREGLLSGLPSRFNIDAVEDSEVVLFLHANFLRLCQEIPALDSLVNTILQRSFVTSQKRIETFLSYTAEQKYGYFLEKYPHLVARVPQTMIASYLGMTPETLSRVRNQLSKK
ncbi:MAG: Crp/Fnr family transcriptional regulator [Bacteroidetes bacterium]|nr:Crp/Fnr family transcriptional regulator [Bacteroidota bacterium]